MFSCRDPKPIDRTAELDFDHPSVIGYSYDEVSSHLIGQWRGNQSIFDQYDSSNYRIEINHRYNEFFFLKEFALVGHTPSLNHAENASLLMIDDQYVLELPNNRPLPIHYLSAVQLKLNGQLFEKVE
jgi:hypothetical protein